MKNKLLPLFFVLGAFSAYSQVGIGKLNPSPSTQLEVYAKDGNKGILIPSVKLKSTTDKTTVTLDNGGYANSLLVFNTETTSDVIPGYYYWYVDKWVRLAVSGETVSGKDGIAGGNGAPGKI